MDDHSSSDFQRPPWLEGIPEADLDDAKWVGSGAVNWWTILDEFFTQSAYGDDERREIRTRYPSSLVGRADAIVKSRLFPHFQSVQDFVRNAFHFMIVYYEWKSNHPDVLEEAERALDRMRIVESQKHRDQLRAIADIAIKHAEDLMSENNSSELRIHLTILEKGSESLLQQDKDKLAPQIQKLHQRLAQLEDRS